MSRQFWLKYVTAVCWTWFSLHHRHFLGYCSLASAALDDMGTRIDDLEKNVLELMSQAGMEEQASPKWPLTLQWAAKHQSSSNPISQCWLSNPKCYIKSTRNVWVALLSSRQSCAVFGSWHCLASGGVNCLRTLNTLIKHIFFYLIQLFQRLFSRHGAPAVILCAGKEPTWNSSGTTRQSWSLCSASSGRIISLLCWYLDSNRIVLEGAKDLKWQSSLLLWTSQLNACISPILSRSISLHEKPILQPLQQTSCLPPFLFQKNWMQL